MGGAGGHMPHPYDLDEVKSGLDLVKILQSIPAHIAQDAVNATLKLDGSNNSVKIIDRRGKYEFALDRGAMGPGKGELDFRGVTPDDYEARGTNPGLQASTNILLGILNEALETTNIEPELKALGLIDEEGNADYSKFLNTEFYQSGGGNAIVYEVGSFIAFHGVYQFYEKWYRRGKPNERQIRTGLPRPTYTDRKTGKEKPIKDASRRIPYDREALERLVVKIRPFAKKEGFKVFGPAAARQKNEKMAKEVLADMESTLAKPITIKISPERDETRTLREWLSQALNPLQSEYTFTDALGDVQTAYQPVITLNNGDTKNVYHKDNVYSPLMIGGEALTDLFADSEGNVNAKAALDSAILFHATRLLGQDIKNHLSTEQFGDVMDHEGIVIRDMAPEDFKITGEFMVSGQAGAFAQPAQTTGEEYLEESEDDATIDLTIVDSEVADVAPAAAAGKTIAIVPGAFKPPHRGHLEMVEHYAANNEEVKVLISNPLNANRTLEDGTVLTAQHALAMWNILASHLENVEIEISPAASPMTAAYEFSGGEGPLSPGDSLTLGASTKGGDWRRWAGANKYVKDGVELKDPEQTAVEPVQHSQEYMDFLLGDGTEDHPGSHLKADMPSIQDPKRDPKDFHASDMRYLLSRAGQDEEAVKLLEDFVGAHKRLKQFLGILGIDMVPHATLEEMSSASGGGAPGGPGKSGPLVTRSEYIPGKRDRKKKKTKKNENIDMSLVKEVYELLIERGILS
jgi:hypothetical protein